MNKEDLVKRITEERGGLANIYRAFLEFPIGLSAHYEFYKSIMLNEDLPLPRTEREYLAVATSKANKCPYCIAHHEKALENQDPIHSLKHKELLEHFAVATTKEPWKSAQFHEQFLSAGYTEAQWQHAVFIVSYFNLANRIAFCMNLDLEENFQKTCN